MQYLKIKFTNIEPLRVGDDSTSQSGQTASLKYIPGTSMRGMVIGRLGKENFENLKKDLFSEKIRFLNAYMVNGEEELIPSPKGFYENKSGDNKLYNVFVQDIVEDGLKRASLGSYCSLSKDSISYYSVNFGSDMRNKIMLSKDEKQNVYRYEYIQPGYIFTSYIAVEDEAKVDVIRNAIAEDFIIGNSRSSGLGKCKVLEKSVSDKIPYYDYSVTTDISNSAYLMLLSDMVMRDEFGEYCGIDINCLEKQLGVTNLKIDSCSTSTVNIKGYNRTTKSKSASVTMYEKGSIFKLSFEGTISIHTIHTLLNKGLGVRKNEGFGRIIFLKDYDKFLSKCEGKWEKTKDVDLCSYKEDKEVLKLIARNHYKNLIEKAIIKTVVSNPLSKGSLTSSQVGALEARIVANRYDYKEAVKEINDYYNHAQEKEDAAKVQKQRNSIKQLKEFVLEVLRSDLEELLGIEHKDFLLGVKTSTILSDEEKGRYKLQYLLDAIHYDNRKEDK